MRISDWSSDVCSSDLVRPRPFACCNPPHHLGEIAEWRTTSSGSARGGITCTAAEPCAPPDQRPHIGPPHRGRGARRLYDQNRMRRRASASFLVGDSSEEHTSELQSLMRISYAVFCLNKKTLVMDKLKKDR